MRKQILTPFRIIASFFVMILCCTSAVALAADLPQGDFKSMAEAGKGRVVEIIDPLTVRLDDDRLISLTGLDYPDLDYYAPGNFSIMTLKILKDFLLDQDVLLYQTKKDELGRINRMGHHVAHVVRKSDRAWVQGLMLSLGLARVRTTKHNPEMAEQMYKIEMAAREVKTGIWAVKGFQVLPAAAAEASVGSFQIVEGEIVKAAMQKNRLFLNFGKDWRHDFTISISAANRRLFTAEGLDPQQWSGKKLRVRGWLETYNGPYIEINHPQQLELLFTSEATENASANENAAENPEEETEIRPEEPKRTVIKRGSALPE